MNKEETLALFAQGRDAWNAWANKMLARRAELEATGQWAIQEQPDGPKPANDATAAWWTVAAADFSEHTFEEEADFRGFHFPFDADFRNTSFKQLAGFLGATFSGYAGFSGAMFSGGAWFEGATFSGYAWFLGATFNGDAGFRDATFNGDAGFGGATFSGDAWFLGATFSGYAEFGDATFSGYTEFGDATFSGTAGFVQTKFEGSVRFDGAEFDKLALFNAVDCARAFSLAGVRFGEVPAFIQAHFAEAPRLDDSRIGPRLGRADADRAARFRALKRLAVQGHDHEREQEYFAGELKSLRGHHDRLLPNLLNLFRKGKAVWPGGARYWFGLGYQVSSDFGRSMLRPLGWLALVAAAFAWGYLGQHFARAAIAGHGYALSSGAWLWGWITSPFAGAARWLGSLAESAGVPPPACLAGTGDPWSAAIGLSIRKALPFAGVASAEKLNQIYACLYGITGDFTAGQPLPDRFTPVIPDVVDYLGIGQLLISLLLIFLFLLAVRNHFRIR